MVSYALFVAFFAKNGIIEGVRLALGDLLFANESMMRLLICLFSIVDIINLELLIVFKINFIESNIILNVLRRQNVK